MFAFDVRKFSGQHSDFAILTVPSVSSGNRFLEIRGSQGRRQALQPLYFGNQPLDFRQSNKRREDPLQLKSLKEKQETEEAKRFKGPAPIAKLQRPGGSTLSFRTLMTGVWDYDHHGKLVFDQKLKDRRQGYITFGKNALVVSISFYIEHVAIGTVAHPHRYISGQKLLKLSTGIAELTLIMLL